LQLLHSPRTATDGKELSLEAMEEMEEAQAAASDCDKQQMEMGELRE
jgi:hypothetical protein